MTLILTVANASGVYQSSDYQLTDQRSGAPISDLAGSKQLQASFKELDLRLAFTGIAAVGVGSAQQRTIDWLADELKALPHDSQLQDICNALRARSTAITKPYGVRGVLEIILTVASVPGPFHVAIISNADWRKRPPEAAPQFTIRIHEITKPLHLILGYRDSVPHLQRHQLRALAKSTEKSPKDVMDSLVAINAIAAKHSRGYVSEACWVTSQTVDGSLLRSASQNIGQRPGNVRILQGNLDMLEWVKKNFQTAPGKEIGIVQSAGVKGPGTPLPPPTGEARRFTLSGSSFSGLLRLPAGDHFASIDLSQLQCDLEIRCNQETSVPFAKVALKCVTPIGKAFPKQLLPWPHLELALMIDDAAVPRGWQYSIGYWIVDKVYHLVIPQASRSVRNVAFLGPDDEMVIVAPTATIELAWGEHDDVPSATIHARVSWRSRVDGTHG